MRIAWLGPTPTEGGGAAFVGTQLLLELARRGVEVDCFIAGGPEDVSPSLEGVQGLRLFYSPKRWAWGRWYSRTPLVAFFSGHLARARAQVAITEMIVERHRRQPYDLVYQFSQSEYSPLRRRRRELPPLVVHPSTHAAGELRWVWREAALARRGEPLQQWLVVTGMLAGRALVQRYELPRADRLLAVSARFAEHLARDYKIKRERLGVVPNPIDLDLFQPAATRSGDRPLLTLLFVSRISARKGVELVIELSHRLADLEGQICVRIVGGPTLWSNYLPLLSELNPAIARFEGQLSATQLAVLYSAADALLQPAMYEPFGLTVGEALACGLPVVASDEVGAMAGVDPRVGRTFPAGDIEAFEETVRLLVRELHEGQAESLRRMARAEAERLFAPETIGEQLFAELTRVIEPDGREATTVEQRLRRSRAPSGC